MDGWMEECMVKLKFFSVSRSFALIISKPNQWVILTRSFRGLYVLFSLFINKDLTWPACLVCLIQILSLSFPVGIISWSSQSVSQSVSHGSSLPWLFLAIKGIMIHHFVAIISKSFFHESHPLISSHLIVLYKMTPWQEILVSFVSLSWFPSFPYFSLSSLFLSLYI